MIDVYDIDSYKKHVVDVVMNWPTGCEDGKRDFLKELGLDVYKTFDGVAEFYVRIPTSFKYDDSEYDISDILQYIADEINDKIGYGIDDIPGVDGSVSVVNSETSYESHLEL